jgi:hypothetical protein
VRDDAAGAAVAVMAPDLDLSGEDDGEAMPDFSNPNEKFAARERASRTETHRSRDFIDVERRESLRLPVLKDRGMSGSQIARSRR